MIKVSIVGATGYVGLELVRLLSRHPQVELVYLSSQSYEGQDIAELYPSLKGTLSHELVALDVEKFARDSDVVFTSLPHGASDVVIPALYEAGVKVIDMSGDFRYDDEKVYEKWYHAQPPRPAGRVGVRPARAPSRRRQGCEPRGQPGLLHHLLHPRRCAAAFSRACRA